MKKCGFCHKLNVYERNGIKISKYCTSCRKIKLAEKKAKHKQTKTYLNKTKKSLHKEAWRLFSIYIRQINANSANIVYCYTCGKMLHWRKAHAGHYIHNKLDFDTRNIHIQCPGCNKYLHGNLAKYGIRLSKELGVEGMQKLELDSNTVSYSIEDLEKIIKDLKNSSKNEGV